MCNGETNNVDNFLFFFQWLILALRKDVLSRFFLNGSGGAYKHVSDTRHNRNTIEERRKSENVREKQNDWQREGVGPSGLASFLAIPVKGKGTGHTHARFTFGPGRTGNTKLEMVVAGGACGGGCGLLVMVVVVLLLVVVVAVLVVKGVAWWWWCCVSGS